MSKPDVNNVNLNDEIIKTKKRFRELYSKAEKSDCNPHRAIFYSNKGGKRVGDFHMLRDGLWEEMKKDYYRE